MGACWPFIWAKLDQLIYGFYPASERWRVNVVYWLGAILLLPLLIQSLPYKRLNAILFFGVYPVVAFVLLTGGNLDLQRFVLGWLGVDFSTIGARRACGSASGSITSFPPSY